MKNLLLASLMLGICAELQGQDGDHPITDGFGRTHLATDANVLDAFGNPVAPFNMTIGLTPGNGATLRVRGDELIVLDQWQNMAPNIFQNTFRTDVGAGINQKWSMVRGTTEMGRIWHPGLNDGFTVQAVVGNMWLRNSDDDGVRVNLNGVAGALLNSYTLDRQGFGAIGEDGVMNNTAPNFPWSRWHLAHPVQGNTPFFGYRPWMRNGTMGTGNSDLFYIGHKYAMTNGTGAEQNDNSDMVAAWGDDELPAGPAHQYDNFSFRYVGALNAGGSAGTIEGLEMMRLRPYRRTPADRIEGFVGIGDWVNTAGAPLPEERLDVLDGRVRIRRLPTDPVSLSAEIVTVNMANGILEHRPIANLPDNCEWSLYQGISPYDHVVTALGPPVAGCPDEDDRVGVGVIAPGAKFHVRANTTFNPQAAYFESSGPGASLYGLGATAGTNAGTSVERVAMQATAMNGSTKTWGLGVEAVSTATNVVDNHAISARAEMAGGYSATRNMGLKATVFGQSQKAVGVDAKVDGGTLETYGANFNATGSSTPGNSVYGVNAYAIGGTSCALDRVYGVKAAAVEGRETFAVHATASSSCGTAWAGLFNGDVTINGVGIITSGSWSPSDANLKTNVQPLAANAMAQLGQLDALTYEYLNSAAPQADLPAGTQTGFMAQQMEQVFPELVRDTQFPSEVDSLGNVIYPAVPFKAINYNGLIPYLVAALKEQNARIDQLQQQVAQCCSTGATESRSMNAGSTSVRPLDSDLRIIPNPVAASTQLRYTVATAGRIRLEVSDGLGRVIEVLEEATREAGEFTYDWNTQHLAPGTYYCALFVDDVPLVKKAVKLNDR